LAASHLRGKAAPFGGCTDRLDEGKGLSFLVVEVVREHRLKGSDDIVERARTNGERLVDSVEKWLEPGVLALHGVDQLGCSGAAGPSNPGCRPQVGVLNAVVDEELGLEVAPAGSDPVGVAG
jgi:hypothetical protein